MTETSEQEIIDSISDKKEHVILFVPDILKQHIDNQYFTYKNQKLKSVYLLDIVHVFMVKYHFQDKEQVGLDSGILRKKYGCYYNFFIEYLLDQGVIIKVREYLPGVRCKKYRLNINIMTSKYFQYKCHDKILIKKKYEYEETLLDEKSSPIPADIRAMLIEDLQHIELDYDGSKDKLDLLHNIGKLDDVKYKKNLAIVETTSQGNLFYSFDKFGRMHTNFTTLKKELRQNFIKIDGQHVAELDIQNSQPTFLIGILKDYLDQIDEKEYHKYVKFCLDGTLYDQLVRASGNTITRKRAKNIVFTVLFGDTTCNNKFFRALFPNIYNFIIKYKKQHKNYKVLAHELQRRESDLIFNKIIRNIKDLYPGIKVFTVHDSIIYPIYFKQYVDKIFKEHLETYYRSVTNQGSLFPLEQ